MFWAKTISIMKNDLQIESIASVPSTNAYAKVDRTLKEGFVLLTDEQTQGKGMGTNQWESNKGKNITGSIIFNPQTIEPSHAFLLSMAVSIGIINFLKPFVPQAIIKWPNDIYVENKKLAGILIENEFTANSITRTIVGIGLNVNQKKFMHAPNPISLTMLTGKTYQTKEVAQALFTSVYNSYHELKQDPETIYSEYHEQLLGINTQLTFCDKTGSFEGKIEQVDTDGMLTILDNQNRVRTYYFKEVEFKNL